MKLYILLACIFLQLIQFISTFTEPTSTNKSLFEERLKISPLDSDRNTNNESAQPQVNYGQQCSITFTSDGTSTKGTEMSMDKNIYEKIIESHVLDEQQLKKLDSIENKFTDINVLFQKEMERFKMMLSEIMKKYDNFESKININMNQKIEELIFKSSQNLEQAVTDLNKELIQVKNKMDFNKNAEKVGNELGNLPSCKEEENIPEDCFDLYYSKGIKRSGVYEVKPLLKSFKVYCDMDTDGGGWTVIQNRFNGSVNFYRNWDNYKSGFGEVGGNSEFWLGLENIHQLTYNQLTKLRVDLQDFNNSSAHEIYSDFQVGSELEGFTLRSIGTFSGSAGNSLTHQVGSKFSTFDNDQDKYSANCAEIYTGAWWYNECHTSNLNGQYLVGKIDKSLENKGMVWTAFRSAMDSLKKSKMMVRKSF